MQPRTAALLIAAVLAGCASHPPAVPAPPSTEAIQAAQLASYTRALQTVVQGNPTEQAEVMATARAAYDQARQGPAALRYGLLLAAPGHPLRNAGRAQTLLREALARPELLTTAETALGVVELARVDTELRLVAERDRLVGELQQEQEKLRVAQTNTALNKRLQAEMEETTRLRKQLDEARAKLDAITRIERNISDRPPATEGRNQ